MAQSISKILKNTATAKRMLISDEQMKLECTKFVAKDGAVKVVYFLTFPDGTELQFGSNPKKWLGNNGYENEVISNAVMASEEWVKLFGANKPTISGL